MLNYSLCEYFECLSFGSWLWWTHRMHCHCSQFCKWILRMARDSVKSKIHFHFDSKHIYRCENFDFCSKDVILCECFKSDRNIDFDSFISPLKISTLLRLFQSNMVLSMKCVFVRLNSIEGTNEHSFTALNFTFTLFPKQCKMWRKTYASVILFLILINQWEI